MEKIVIFSGAGISAESGLKTFRDSDGLWNNYSLEEVATPQAWEHKPQLVTDFYNMRRREVLKAQPNLAHQLIAKLEKWYEVIILTQNIDNLHERAGSTKVIHLHGEIIKKQSDKNPQLIENVFEDISLKELTPDGGKWRPHVVWFGEPVPMYELATQIIPLADIFIVIGTSLTVAPVSNLVFLAKKKSRKFYIDPQASEDKLSLDNTFTTIKNIATLGTKYIFDALKK